MVYDAKQTPSLLRPIVLAAAFAVLAGFTLPENVPVPEPRPEPEKQAEQPEMDVQQPDKEKPKAEKEEAYVPPPIEKEDPKRLAKCLTQLRALGVEFREIPAISDGDGCGIDHPLVVSAVGPGIGLNPEGKLRCAAALALARWTAGSVIPALRIARPEESLAGLEQASAYVCRKRNSASTGKISEHAHGNAVDIASFRFKSGNAFTIRPRIKDSTMDGALQRTITAAACLYFTTVLDPGSDAAHETHLHLDILKRKGGYRYCW